jgi:hypothetical protein
VTVPEAVRRLQPRRDLARFGALVETVGVRLINELPRGEPCLLVDVVQVGLERHDMLLSWRAGSPLIIIAAIDRDQRQN